MIYPIFDAKYWILCRQNSCQYRGRFSIQSQSRTQDERKSKPMKNLETFQLRYFIQDGRLHEMENLKIFFLVQSASFSLSGDTNSLVNILRLI